MRKVAVLFAVLLVAVACTEGLPSPTEGIGVTSAKLEAFLASGTAAGKCFIWPPVSQSQIGDCLALDAAVTPKNFHCGSLNYQCMEQKAPVHFVFNAPAYEVDIVTEGQYFCSSPDKGVAYYYSRGKLVETGHLGLLDSVGQCFEVTFVDGQPAVDSMAQQATYLSTFKGPIDSIVITRPFPDTVVIDWPPFLNGQGDYIVSDVSANYIFRLYEKPGDQATSCLTNGTDPYMDRQTIRDLFRQLWDSSGTGLPAGQRTERGAWVYEDTATGGLIVVPQPFNPTTDNACHSEFATPGGVGGAPLFHVHTHPFIRGEVTPQYCWTPGTNPSMPGTYNPRRYGGPSKSDLVNIAAFAFPEYIVDSTHVYAVPANATLRNAAGVTKRFARRQGTPACNLF